MSTVLCVSCRQSKGTIYTLEPGETVFYTWDHPNDRRALRWGLLSLRVKDPKHIFVDKVSRSLASREDGLVFILFATLRETDSLKSSGSI